MRAIRLLLFFSLFTSIKAQQKTDTIYSQTISTTSGLRITLLQEGSGTLIEKGDRVRLHYTGSISDSKKFDSSTDKNQPFEFTLGAGQVIPGWEEGLTYLRKGSIASLFVPSDLGYGDIPMPGIPVNSDLTYQIEILEVEKGYLPKLVPFEKRKTKTLSSGIKLMMLKKGKGAKVKKEKSVEVNYTGYLENGNIFESSILRGKTISFVLGSGLVIKGWEEALAQLRQGDKVQIYIPSLLAYGDLGRPPLIPPNAALYFNLEVISVK